MYTVTEYNGLWAVLDPTGRVVCLSQAHDLAWYDARRRNAQ